MSRCTCVHVHVYVHVCVHVECTCKCMYIVHVHQSFWYILKHWCTIGPVTVQLIMIIHVLLLTVLTVCYLAQDVIPMAHILTIFEPIWPMLQNVSNTLFWSMGQIGLVCVPWGIQCTSKLTVSSLALCTMPNKKLFKNEVRLHVHVHSYHGAFVMYHVYSAGMKVWIFHLFYAPQGHPL